MNTSMTYVEAIDAYDRMIQLAHRVGENNPNNLPCAGELAALVTKLHKAGILGAGIDQIPVQHSCRIHPQGE